jgi:hypothetical protein
MPLAIAALYENGAGQAAATVTPDRQRRPLGLPSGPLLEVVIVDPQVHIDPETSLGSAENLRGPLEQQLTSALQAAVKKVDGDYHGEGVQDVADELLAGTKHGLHSDIAEGFAPDQVQLRSVAAEIVENNAGSDEHRTD